MIHFKNISKSFGGKPALEDIDLTIEKGSIHCLLGENGAGKTTLMNIFFGLFGATQGEIFVKETKLNFNSPKNAIDFGLGMIHQHFMLVPRLSVLENIIAGNEPKKGLLVDTDFASKRITKLSKTYNLAVDPHSVVETLSVGQQQRVEILKALYRDAKILIFDEPTAVLTPDEVLQLFKILRKLKSEGKTIIFITHKLDETMGISDFVTILRRGKQIATLQTKDTDAKQLANMMVGRDVKFNYQSRSVEGEDEVLVKVEDLSVSLGLKKLNNINFEIATGEILGVAGVDGNGQLELEEALVGIIKAKQGKIYYKNQDISNLSISKRREFMGAISSDRLKYSMIKNFDLMNNSALGFQRKDSFSKGITLDYPTIRSHTEKLIDEYDVRCEGPLQRASALSGGNQQKIVLAKEISQDPKFIIVSQPTRGLDIGAIEFIHNLLLSLRDSGTSILLISTELEEVLNLSDNIIVLYEGEIIGQSRNFTKQKLGLLMAGRSS